MEGGEMLVTAQRRQERLIETPVTVSAIGARGIEQLRLNNPTQLRNLVPRLEFADTTVIPSVAIRGIKLNDFGFANESPIALYTNDVYMSSPVSALSEFYDVSRVEVQRGPQGTLFGRNATGGLIQIITNKPTADFSGGASLQYGSFGQIILDRKSTRLNSSH